MLLDTSVAILVRDGAEHAEEQLAGRPGSSYLSVVSRVELEGGVYTDLQAAPARRRRLDQMLAEMTVLPFGNAEADAYGVIVATCGFSRSRILDRMIAATALVHDLVVATCNPRDFENIPGLQVQDWSN